MDNHWSQFQVHKLIWTSMFVKKNQFKLLLKTPKSKTLDVSENNRFQTFLIQMICSVF